VIAGFEGARGRHAVIECLDFCAQLLRKRGNKAHFGRLDRGSHCGLSLVECAAQRACYGRVEVLEVIRRSGDAHRKPQRAEPFHGFRGALNPFLIAIGEDDNLAGPLRGDEAVHHAGTAHSEGGDAHVEGLHDRHRIFEALGEVEGLPGRPEPDGVTLDLVSGAVLGLRLDAILGRQVGGQRFVLPADNPTFVVGHRGNQCRTRSECLLPPITRFDAHYPVEI
jgi:hypothetical protein